jgi:hypothetical protein
MGNDFGTLEFQFKCFFCPAQSEKFSEGMGYVWSKEWTCPHCGITYHVGKSFWGGTRCLYINIDQGNENTIQKTAEWERSGHLYPVHEQKIGGNNHAKGTKKIQK